MKILTLGSFDILHAGHIKLLKFCHSLGNTVVGLNTDEFIEKYKKNKPILNYEQREETIMAIGCVDRIVPNDQPRGTASELILEERPDIIVVGSDWAVKDYVGQLGINWEWLETMNISICYFPRHIKMSTTLIKERVKNG